VEEELSAIRFGIEVGKSILVHAKGTPAQIVAVGVAAGIAGIAAGLGYGLWKGGGKLFGRIVG
jgi:hypothetical protein